jgi:DNA-binding CsgD family transcriptional regulator
MTLQSKPVLTKRQTEILELLKKGLTNQDICRLLGISPNTVKVHLAKIYKILDVSNRTEAACYGDVAPVGDDYAQILFRFNPAVVADARAKWCFAAIAQSLQKFELLQIIVENNPSHIETSHFWIVADLSSPGVKPKTMNLSLYHRLSREVLWTAVVDLSEEVDETTQLQRLVVKLAIQIEKSGADMYSKEASLNSGWWYASMYGKKAISIRTMSAWQESVKITEMAHNNQPEKILPISLWL